VTGQGDPRRLARELLGRDLEDLDPEEQRVLKRVAAGTLTGMDAQELAQTHASFGDRLADRVAAIGGGGGCPGGFAVVRCRGVLHSRGVLKPPALPVCDRYPFFSHTLWLPGRGGGGARAIRMSRTRRAAKARIAARHDYEVNLRTQLEIIRLSHKLDRLAREIGHVEGEVRRDEL